MQNKKLPWSRRFGFTMVELLVVIAILAILAAIIVPQLRIFTKDRGVRETARVVGEMLNDASIRARATGFGGVAFVRNRNFKRFGSLPNSTDNPIYYASTRMFQLRQFPSYSGTAETNQANPPTGAVIQTSATAGAFEAIMPYPLDSASLSRIQNMEWREATLNGQVYRALGYQVAEGANYFRVQFQGPYTGVPGPGANGSIFTSPRTEVDFTIDFIPAIRSGTQIDLPDGYYVDLNYSGNIDLADVDADSYTWTRMSSNVPIIPGGGLNPDIKPNEYSVAITFNASGGVDTIYTNGAWVDSYFSNENLYFCIAEFDPQYSFEQNQAVANPDLSFPLASRKVPPTDLLSSSLVMWIQVNPQSGKVSVLDSVPPLSPIDKTMPGTQMGRILEAQRIAVKGVNSNQ